MMISLFHGDLTPRGIGHLLSMYINLYIFLIKKGQKQLFNWQLTFESPYPDPTRVHAVKTNVPQFMKHILHRLRFSCELDESSIDSFAS